MSTGKGITRILIGIGVAILQIMASQLVTFLASLAFPGMENFPQTHPVLFVVILGATYLIGIFGIGWLAIRVHWLKIEFRTVGRLVGTFIGVYLAMAIALLTYHPVGPDNPFLFPIAPLTGIMGFYMGGLFGKK